MTLYFIERKFWKILLVVIFQTTVLLLTGKLLKKPDDGRIQRRLFGGPFKMVWCSNYWDVNWKCGHFDNRLRRHGRILIVQVKDRYAFGNWVIDELFIIKSNFYRRGWNESRCIWAWFINLMCETHCNVKYRWIIWW